MATHLITGGSGFVGRHIARHLLARGDRVVATHGPGGDIDKTLMQSGMVFEGWSLGDTPGLELILRKYAPSSIYHLASPAHVPTAQSQPHQTAMDVFIATIKVVEAIRSQARGARLLYVGSSEEYMNSNGVPLKETSPVAGQTAYAISKAAATQWVKAMAADFAVCVRPFNQIGPYQSPKFAVSSFASQIARIGASESARVLNVGNLDVERDFVHIEDSSRAHILALEEGVAGEIYNIASGKPTRLRNLVEHMIELRGGNIEILVDPARVRPGEVPRIVGNAEKLEKATGWRPVYSAFDAAAAALRAAMVKI